MANITPWPHRNVVIGTRTSGLHKRAIALLAKPDVDFAPYPKNKYIVKYSYGVKTRRLKPAYVYYLRLDFLSGLTVYKIGYTSMTVRKRIDFFMLDSSTRVTILETIKCKSSKTAFHVEQLLHREFAACRYYGKVLIASGNSELYIKPLI